MTGGARGRPKVGVGVPVFNGERYLSETLDALLAQTYEDFVILIGDNASTDRSFEIAQDYASRDRRVVVIRRERNIGANENYSDLFRRAGTEYFRWHAADDLSLPEYTRLAVEVLDQQPEVVLAYCKTINIDGAGLETACYEDRMHVVQDRAADRLRWVLKQLDRCNCLYGLARSATMARTGLIRPFVSSDKVFLGEMALYGKLVEIPDRLFRRRFYEAASSAMTPSARQVFVYGARKSRRAELEHWQHIAAYYWAVTKAPVPMAERLALYREVTRQLRDWRPVMLKEARTALAHITGPGRG